MPEHRWTVPCRLPPDDAEEALAPVLAPLEEDGWESIPHIETVGFFGWTLKAPDGRAVGVSVPQPTGPPTLMVRSDHRELGERVVAVLTGAGPLEGRQASELERGESSRSGAQASP